MNAGRNAGTVAAGIVYGDGAMTTLAEILVGPSSKTFQLGDIVECYTYGVRRTGKVIQTGSTIVWIEHHHNGKIQWYHGDSLTVIEQAQARFS